MARPKLAPPELGLSKAEAAGAARLLGCPVEIAGPETEKPLERLLLLQQKLAGAAQPKRNRYQSDFLTFLHACWTADEARGGKVAPMPQYPYLAEIAEALLTEPLLFIEKSRRVLASWAVCCFDIWVAAGGQDPRWPILMNATGNRQVFIVSRKFESSCFFLERRVKFIVDQFEERGFREEWPEFPTWSWKQGEGNASNGSVISAVAQGSDQTRGQACTLGHLEEVAFWERAQQTLEGLLPTTQGGGHVVCITTPQAGTYAARLVRGQLKRQWR